jgi:hypothetical protein
MTTPKYSISITLQGYFWQWGGAIHMPGKTVAMREKMVPMGGEISAIQYGINDVGGQRIIKETRRASGITLI